MYEGILKVLANIKGCDLRCENSGYCKDIKNLITIREFVNPLDTGMFERRT